MRGFVVRGGLGVTSSQGGTTPTGNTINVSNVTQLVNAVSSANSSGNTTIVLADGTYQISSDLAITANNVTIKSASGIRANVIIQGDAMSSTAAVGDVIQVFSSNFTIQDITIRFCKFSGIQIHGESNAQFPTISNCVIVDTFQHPIKVSDNGTGTPLCQGGVLANCLIGFTASAAPAQYNGGIDLHNGQGWSIRDNTFQNVQNPNNSVTSPCEAVVHCWRGGGNNVVERNRIINCDRGIQFGLFGDSSSNNCIARNNVIYHAANGALFPDVSLDVENSVGCEIGNNTVYNLSGYPNALEYRGTTTGAILANNLLNLPMLARDGGTATLNTNNTGAQASWFTNISTGDPTLSSAIVGVVNSGTTMSWVTADFFNTARPKGAAYDIGAYEF